MTNTLKNTITAKNFMELGREFGFRMVEMDGVVILQSKNTDREDTNWLKYNTATDTFIIVGNTDHMNIWLNKTRPDLTPEKLVEFNNRLNDIMEFDERTELKEYVDPEDWQAIADINDAYEDERYYTKKAA